MPAIDIQKIDMLIKAFNINSKNEAWDENEKRTQFSNFIFRKTKDATSLNKDSAATKMKRAFAADGSIIKIKNGKSTELYLMSGHLQSLGEGSSGRAKLAIRLIPMDDDFNLYAIKREWTNNDKQQKETETLKDLNILVGDKMQRASTTIKRPESISKNQANPNDNSKFYTVMPYLGEWLPKVVWNNKSNEKTKLDLGIQIALQLHNLHTKARYAHLDLKPDNITVDTSTPGVYKVHLIDFGFSKKLDSSNELTFVGTAGYLPGTTVIAKSMDRAVYNKLKDNYATIGHIGLDVFALKRTLSQEGLDNRIALIDVTSKYDLALMLSDLSQAEEGKIYLSEKPPSYYIKGMSKYASIPPEIDLTNLETKLDDPAFRSDILTMTSKAGHTLTSLKTVNRVLYEMLSTPDDLAALQRKDTAAMIAANLILHSLKIYPACTLSDENSKEIISLYEEQKTALDLKDKLEAKLKYLYPKISEAAQILETHLGVKPGSFILDDDSAQKILSLNTSIQDTNVLKNKLQQLFFFTQVLGINIPVEKLSDTPINFPDNYPNTKLLLKQKGNICLCFMEGMLTTLNLDHSRIGVNQYVNMMHVLYTEEDELKKKITLLLIYLEIQIDEDVLKSPQKCQSILEVFQKLQNVNFDDQKDLIQKCLVLSNRGMISALDIGDVAANATPSNVQTIISKHNLNPDSIDLKKRIDMLYTLCTEIYEFKKNVKLLSIYLEIPIDEKILNSKQECLNILRVLENPGWKQQDFSKQQELMRKYLTFSKIDIISKFNFVELARIDNKELENCQQYLQPPYTDRFTVKQLDELKVKVNKMLTIQMTFSLFFDKNLFPVNASGLYTMPEQQLDAILKSCTQLLSMMDTKTLLIRNEILGKQVADSKEEIIMQIKDTDKYVVVNDVANAYKIPLLGKNITPKRLEEMHKLLVELHKLQREDSLPPTCYWKPESDDESEPDAEKRNTEQDQKNILLFKAILAYLDLDNVFDDANIPNISDAMNKCYCNYCEGNPDVDYCELKRYMAIQTILKIVSNNYSQFKDIESQNIRIKGPVIEACIVVYDYYQNQTQENRLNFNDVLKVGLNAFEAFETGDKKSSTLQTFLTAALDEHKAKFTQSKLKTELQEARETAQPAATETKPAPPL